MKELVIVYEREQVDVVECYLKTTKDAQVIAFDYWIEQDLNKRGIKSLPLIKYIKPWADFTKHVVSSEAISRQWYTLAETSFLTYKGISIGGMIEAAFSHYLQEVQGSLYIFESILDSHKDVECFIVPHSTIRTGPNTGPFAQFQASMIINVGKFVTQHHAIAFKSIGVMHETKTVLFPHQTFWRRLFLQVYNFCMNTFVSRRSVRILASDHWRNIRTVIERMDDTELVFVDRKEIRNIPLAQLLKYRIRFVHPLDALTQDTRTIAKAQQKEFRISWSEAKKVVGALPGFTHQGVNWWPLVEPALSFVVETYAERFIADIESIASILTKEQINRVLIRASVSGQHHFFIMGELPQQLGIPSVEIQHGIGVGILGPHSAFGHLHADFVAAYGPFVRHAFVRSGYAPERIQLTGSPRFDRYVTERDAVNPEIRDKKLIALGLDPKRPVIFVVMPAELHGCMFGTTNLLSYEYREYLQSLRDIKEALPEIQYIFKFRSHALLDVYSDYAHTLFPEGGISLQSGDPFPLILLSDFVYSCFSTLASECIMGRKPVILFPLKASDAYFYEAHKDGIISVPRINEKIGLPVQEVIAVSRKLINDKTFYIDAVKKGEQYLSENFTFTGDAAKQVADFLQTVSISKNNQNMYNNRYDK